MTRMLPVIAMLLTALALIPGGAHLLTMPAKLQLDAASYFTVQQIYRGWAFLGIIIIAAILANLLAAIAIRAYPRALPLSCTAAVLLGTTLIVFFTWTFPTNQATANWTVMRENWQELRLQWEYSHAVNAGITFIALCCAALAQAFCTPPPTATTD